MSFGDNELPKSFGGSKYKPSNRQSKFRPQTNQLKLSLEAAFNKKFEFGRYSAPQQWTLPNEVELFSSEPWKINHMQTLKSGLNFQKSRLNDYFIEDWSAHTAKRNPAGDIRWRLRNDINPEFLTQAWTKFYECVSSYDVISEDAINNKKLNSLHLCEAPGAFVASLNHFMKLHYKDFQWQWMATTLNPYHENNSVSSMICDDRFILHTLENWDFGLDHTGNLMDWDNSQDLINRAKAMGKVDLVTADGSIDCMLNPDEQEDCVAPLHFCEIITALQALSKGGVLVFKLFTMFEHSTINLLYLLAVLFERINIFKPVTSKHGNSEVYAICLNYDGPETIEPYLQKIKAVYGKDELTSKAMFPLQSLPQSFLDQIQACSFYFYVNQCKVIDYNILTYEHPEERKDSSLKKFRYAVAQTFMQRYELLPIGKECEILRGLSHEESTTMHLNPRNYRGSYTERVRSFELSKQEKIAKINEELNSLEDANIAATNDLSIKWIAMTQNTVSFKFTHGTLIEEVRSSKFVVSQYLRLSNKLKEYCSEDIFNCYFMKELSNQCCDNVHTLVFNTRKACEKHDDWEKACFGILASKLETLNLEDMLVLKNYSLLTQFSVGVLFAVASLSFEEIGFGNDCSVYLKSFRNKVEVAQAMGRIQEEVDLTKARNLSENGLRSVLGIVSVQCLGLGDFYHGLLVFNNNVLFMLSKKYISLML